MKHGYKLIFLITAFLLLIMQAEAAWPGYNFSSSSGTYTEITGGTVLGANTNDDQIYSGRTIGFGFIFNGNNYNYLSVSSNGYLIMGS
ncbi:MAG: hypothetical protein QG635_472, partial [Bacteroidota bacterium]|nr:hypothetical protein [Bacteroidota bacterium]